MIPPLIVQEALQRNINLIAITDHNASANISAVQKAARNTPSPSCPAWNCKRKKMFTVYVCLTHWIRSKLFQAFVNTKLPPIKNKPDFFGEQFVVDETGDFIRREDQLVILSANINLKEAQRKVAELDGLFIPAHINRKAFGLFSHLGLLPEDMPIDALEISRHMSLEEAIQKYPGISKYPLIQNGDVHFLADFLGAALLHLAAPTIPEIKLALKNLDGRSLENVPAA